VLTRLRIEAVIKRRIGGQFRIEGVSFVVAHHFQSRIAYTQFSIVADPEFAADLKRDSCKCLMRAHVSSTFIFARGVFFWCDISLRDRRFLA
jgi:hypothetical protein